MLKLIEYFDILLYFENCISFKLFSVFLQTHKVIHITNCLHSNFLIFFHFLFYLDRFLHIHLNFDWVILEFWGNEFQQHQFGNIIFCFNFRLKVFQCKTSTTSSFWWILCFYILFWKAFCKVIISFVARILNNSPAQWVLLLE